tara:strand:+ start:23 stop:616 length:594 start_codon:yes stop_codon:yes gene_type:complete
MNKTEVAKKLGTAGLKYAMTKDPNTAMVKKAFEKTKGFIDSDISKQELENLKAAARNNCKIIQMIIEYLQTNDGNILKELSGKFSGFGVDTEGNQVVQQCNLDDINYKEYINDKVDSVKNVLGLESETEQEPQMRRVNPILLEENDDEDVKNKVYYNPALDIGAKKFKRSKRKTKRKSKLKTKKKTKRKTKKKCITI